MHNPQLKLFTDATVLHHTNRDLLVRFFERFTHLLPKYSLPNPTSDYYPNVLAGGFQRPSQFPAPLVEALVAVEDLAAALNHVPDPSGRQDPDSARLTQAIELWLGSPAAAAIASSKTQPTPPRSQTRNGSSSIAEVSPMETRPPQAPVTQTPKPTLDSSRPATNPDLLDDFLRLARLSRVEYDRVRLTEAQRFGLRVRTLDAQVARYRAQLLHDAEANAVQLPELEPWPEPVDGALVLDEVLSRFNRYLALCAGADVAITLWDAHTHAFRAFHQTPRLNLHSSQGGCGKTTTLEVLATMTPRPLSTENLKPAVLFRVVDQQQPTLLLDELDTYLYQANELRGLLNAGHKRGACAYRCEGAGNHIRAFNAFAPAALAGIGQLPPTLRDRSILIPLTKAKPGEIPTRFDSNNTQTETILGRKLARWASDNFDALAACNPAMPPGAFNRLADNWRPLFAIAQIAGGDWPQRAAEAFALLTPKPQTDQDLDLTLLADIRSVFNASTAQRLFSTTLVAALNALPKSQPRADTPLLAPASLARRLSRFEIRPRAMRIGNARAKGYHLADFADAFAHHLTS